MRAKALLILVLLPASALAHGANPRVLELVAAPAPESLWVVTDVQGVFGLGGVSGTRWLCEDAVRPNAGFLSVVPLSEDGRRFVVATVLGLASTDDAGCTFAAVEGPLGATFTLGLRAHPEDRGDLITASALPRGPNDVWRSVDGGRVWTPAGLALEGPARSVVRGAADPTHVWLSGPDGLFHSADSGASFAPLSLEVDGETPDPGSVYFLGGPAAPARREEVWAVVQRLPWSLLVRSVDAGARWSLVTRISDPVGSIAFDPQDERRVLVATVFGVPWRTDDGLAWRELAPPAAGFGCLASPRPGEPLRACADPAAGAPWTVAESDDFGDTWRPIYTRFQDTRARWGCAPESAAERACATLCPGAAPGAECALCAAPERCVEADAGGPAPDLGPLLDATATDAATPSDAAVVVDAGGAPPTDVGGPLDLERVEDATRLRPEGGPVVPSVVPSVGPPAAPDPGGCETRPSSPSSARWGLLWAAAGVYVLSLRRRR
jgi:hypothetical protein